MKSAYLHCCFIKNITMVILPLFFFKKWLLNDESDGAVICPDSEQSYEGLAHSIYTGMATLCGKSSLCS